MRKVKTRQSSRATMKKSIGQLNRQFTKAICTPDGVVLYPNIVETLLTPQLGNVITTYLENQGFTLDPKVRELLNTTADTKYLNWVLNGKGEPTECEAAISTIQAILAKRKPNMFQKIIAKVKVKK